MTAPALYAAIWSKAWNAAASNIATARIEADALNLCSTENGNHLVSVNWGGHSIVVTNGISEERPFRFTELPVALDFAASLLTHSNAGWTKGTSFAAAALAARIRNNEQHKSQN